MAKFAMSREKPMSLNVSLPIELENRVREHVASGLYGSASEVIREALRLFEAYQQAQIGSLQLLKSDIAKGMADVHADRVSVVNMENIKSEGRKKLKMKRDI